MADKHHGEALVGQPTDQLEDLLGLGDAERRRGLVQNHDSRVPDDRSGDGDRLTLAAGQARDLLADRRDGPHRQPIEGLGGPALHRPLVEAAPLRQLPAQKQVVDDVKVVAQSEVLVDDLDPERVGLFGVGDTHLVAVEAVVAGVEGVDAGQPLDQGALAGAVVPHQRRDLTGAGVEVHVLQDVDRPEAFVHGPQRQQRLGALGGCDGSGARDRHVRASQITDGGVLAEGCWRLGPARERAGPSRAVGR